MKIRLSLGTAVALGLSDVRCPDLPTTGYLLQGQGCSGKCTFCPQAGAKDDSRLSRVIWPEYEVAELAAAIGSGNHGLRRLCLQATRQAGTEDVLTKRLQELAKHGLPLCLSAGVDNLAQVDRWLKAGAEKVSIALDACTPELFREIKVGDFPKTLALLEEAAENYPGRIATHLIAGLGETEEEIVKLIARLRMGQITVALFAFTPVAGTPLAKKKPPEMGSWRRLQMANFLLAKDPSLLKKFLFTKGRIAGFGVGQAVIRAAGDTAFRTSGCPDCNRPYYNERPGTELYNYPCPLTNEELEQAINRLGVEK